MSTDLESLIREVAARGQFNHLSVIPKTVTGKGTVFAAMLRTTKGENMSAQNADPVEAIRGALTAAIPKRSRAVASATDARIHSEEMDFG